MTEPDELPDEDTETPCEDCGHLWAFHEGYRCTVQGCDCDEG